MTIRIGRSLTETELVEGCKKQQARAQRELYERFAPKMLGVCLRYVKDTAEAEDIMVASLLKVFDKIHQYSGQGSFEGWVRRIVVNEALGFLRKHKMMQVALDLEYAAEAINYVQIDDGMGAQEIMDVLNEMPVGYKTIFNLYAIEGYNHKEIAEMLGVSENTSKSQLSRARLHLQKKLVERDRIEDQNNGKS
ncbi:MAG: RNA polymerase sigma factor [Cyclobacteriaceae bacterium]